MKKLTSLLLFLLPFIVFSGGWPKAKGAGYFKLGYSSINGMHFFSDVGIKTPLVQNLRFTTLSVYGEYGVTDKITAITYVPFLTTARLEGLSGSDQRSLTSFGDINVGFRYGLRLNKPTVVSVSVAFGLPTGQSANEGDENALQTGDGEFNQLIRIETGHSLKNGFYASSFLGVNFRSQGFSEEIHFGGEVGHVNDGLISILKVQSIQSLNNGDNTESANSNLFNNNMELLTLAPELALKVSDKIGVSLNYTIYLSGKKTLASPNATFGIFWDL